MNTKKAEAFGLEYGDSAAVVRKEENADIYRELTGEGKVFCTLAGLIEEIVVLLALGIVFRMSLIPVFMFLWLLFAILTEAALIGMDILRNSCSGI